MHSYSQPSDVHHSVCVSAQTRSPERDRAFLANGPPIPMPSCFGHSKRSRLPGGDCGHVARLCMLAHFVGALVCAPFQTRLRQTDLPATIPRQVRAHTHCLCVGRRFFHPFACTSRPPVRGHAPRIAMTDFRAREAAKKLSPKILLCTESAGTGSVAECVAVDDWSSLDRAWLLSGRTRGWVHNAACSRSKLICLNEPDARCSIVGGPVDDGSRGFETSEH